MKGNHTDFIGPLLRAGREAADFAMSVTTHRTARQDAVSSAFRAAVEAVPVLMDEARAAEIVAAMQAYTLYEMGLAEREPPPLDGYSLWEMLQANAVIRAKNERAAEAYELGGRKGSHSVSTTCDDRMVAALYALTHYDPEDPQDCKPLHRSATRGVFVLRLPHPADAADEQRDDHAHGEERP